MTRKIDIIAEKLGAKVESRIPDTGGGAFGMMRLAEVLAHRLQPSTGRRPGRPTDPTWVIREKVPMSYETKEKLSRLAREASQGGKSISPMQVAAQLLEESLASYKMGTNRPD